MESEAERIRIARAHLENVRRKKVSLHYTLNTLLNKLHRTPLAEALGDLVQSYADFEVRLHNFEDAFEAYAEEWDEVGGRK